MLESERRYNTRSNLESNKIQYLLIPRVPTRVPFQLSFPSHLTGKVSENAASSKRMHELASSTVFIQTVKVMDSRMVEILEHACSQLIRRNVLLDEFRSYVSKDQSDSVRNRFIIVNTIRLVNFYRKSRYIFNRSLSDGLIKVKGMNSFPFKIDYNLLARNQIEESVCVFTKDSKKEKSLIRVAFHVDSSLFFYSIFIYIAHIDKKSIFEITIGYWKLRKIYKFVVPFYRTVSDSISRQDTRNL